MVWQGIEYLIEHGLLSHTAEDVAQFLFKGEGLNKTAIGDYLGERYFICCLICRTVYCTLSYSVLLCNSIYCWLVVF